MDEPVKTNLDVVDRVDRTIDAVVVLSLILWMCVVFFTCALRWRAVGLIPTIVMGLFVSVNSLLVARRLLSVVNHEMTVKYISVATLRGRMCPECHAELCLAVNASLVARKIRVIYICGTAAEYRYKCGAGDRVSDGYKIIHYEVTRSDICKTLAANEDVI